MGTEESKALMRRITEEIWNQGRLDLIPELISDHLIDHIDQPGLEGEGQQRYRNHVEMTRAMYSDFRNELDLVVGEGDIAVSYGWVVGTNDGPMMGVPPTGRRVECETIGVLRFAGGRAVERWAVTDGLTMMQQLGLMG
jgi:predicted ester cyclase